MQENKYNTLYVHKAGCSKLPTVDMDLTTGSDEKNRSFELTEIH